MGIVEIILVSLGLSMDAFAVSICKGLSMKKLSIKNIIIIGLYFGIFQCIMPLIGYYLGSTLESFITSVDHWIAFLLFVFIGLNMIKDAFIKNDIDSNDKVDFKTMIVLAVATSIDSLAIGLTLAFLNTNIIMSVLSIGITSFIVSVLGVLIGNKFGSRLGKKAQVIGGVVIIIIGLKILFEHLKIFN